MQGTAPSSFEGLPKSPDSSGPKPDEASGGPSLPALLPKAPDSSGAKPDGASGGPSQPGLQVFTRKRSNEMLLVEQKQYEVHENQVLKLKKVKADLDKRVKLAKLKLEHAERLLQLAKKQKEEREEFYSRLIKIQTQQHETHILQLGVACLRGRENVTNVLGGEEDGRRGSPVAHEEGSSEEDSGKE